MIDVSSVAARLTAVRSLDSLFLNEKLFGLESSG